MQTVIRSCFRERVSVELDYTELSEITHFRLFNLQLLRIGPVGGWQVWQITKMYEVPADDGSLNLL